jgi:hypothetical protein
LLYNFPVRKKRKVGIVPHSLVSGADPGDSVSGFSEVRFQFFGEAIILNRGDVIVIDENANAAAERFMGKLKEKEFGMARSPNTEEDYAEAKQERDTQAVNKFADSELFDCVMGQK